VDSVPGTLLLRKSGSARNFSRDLGSLDHRGGLVIGISDLIYFIFILYIVHN
jgi:hypothetical protein